MANPILTLGFFGSILSLEGFQGDNRNGPELVLNRVKERWAKQFMLLKNWNRAKNKDAEENEKVYYTLYMKEHLF